MKKACKILVMILLIMLMIFSNVYASSPISVVEKAIKRPADGIDKAQLVGNRVLFIVQVVGSIIAISMLTVLGIKYMVAAPDGKAEIKKQAIIYIVGAVFLFGSVALVEIIKKFGTSF